MLAKRLIKSNDAGGGACTNTVDLYNPFPDGGGVALYQLNGNADDVSGNYNGTASNVTYGAGQFGQAGVFNGSSSVISNTVGATAITSFSMWVKFNSTSQSSYLQVFDNNDYAIFLHNGKLNVQYSAGSTSNGVAWTITNTTDWFHIAGTITSSSSTLYVDKVEKTESMNNWVNAGSVPYIGNRNDLTGYFSGSIDQVRIFSRALRPYEVEALYTEEYCTPTIVPSEHFSTITYEGTNTTQSTNSLLNQVGTIDFQPDLIWFKNRTGTNSNALFDSVRGRQSGLFSDLTVSETTSTSTQDLVSFDSNGFTLGTISNAGSTNVSGGNIVAWCWKAGGSAVTNNDGTTPSQVSANVEAGFSIVTWTTNLSPATLRVGHGLGQTPDIVIFKRRSSPNEDWYVLSNLFDGSYLLLNSTAGLQSLGSSYSTSVTDTLLTSFTSAIGIDYVAYCFAEVEGFSNFGSYVGNGISQSIVTGFEPAFLMIKLTNAAGGSWAIIDNKRDITNPRDAFLRANTSDSEANASNFVNFNSNGFSFASDVGNGNGSEYIYMAFAADPTTIEPSLEDSFNTVTWTGDNAVSRDITGVGFQPDFTWIKSRTLSASHGLYDSVRGAAYWLRSEFTDLEQFQRSTGYLNGFIADGFNLQKGSSTDPTYTGWFETNQSGQNYVAWNWKGAELPAINSNGSITSVVSANPAAGFSIVSYKGNGANATIGHGLGDAPDMIIVKRRNASGSWNVYHSALGNNSTLILQSTIAELIGQGTWGTTTPTSSVFTVGTGVNDTNNYIAYCFAEVAGFSKFGSYVGNGNVNGPTITTDFEPAFVIIKASSTVSFDRGHWVMKDNKRDTTNPNSANLYPNLSNAEDTSSVADVNFLSNGFQPAGTYEGTNEIGKTYIYMAFANQF